MMMIGFSCRKCQSACRQSAAWLCSEVSVMRVASKNVDGLIAALHSAVKLLSDGMYFGV